MRNDLGGQAYNGSLQSTALSQITEQRDFFKCPNAFKNPPGTVSVEGQVSSYLTEVATAYAS